MGAEVLLCHTVWSAVQWSHFLQGESQPTSYGLPLHRQPSEPAPKPENAPNLKIDINRPGQISTTSQLFDQPLNRPRQPYQPQIPNFPTSNKTGPTSPNTPFSKSASRLHDEMVPSTQAEILSSYKVPQPLISSGVPHPFYPSLSCLVILLST